MLKLLKPQKEGNWVDHALRVSIRFMIIGFTLAFGFTSIMASNMGPAYLPNVCNGCLDIGIRLTLLAIGAVLWIATVGWLIWIVFRYFYYLLKRTK